MSLPETAPAEGTSTEERDKPVSAHCLWGTNVLTARKICLTQLLTHVHMYTEMYDHPILTNSLTYMTANSPNCLIVSDHIQDVFYDMLT